MHEILKVKKTFAHSTFLFASASVRARFCTSELDASYWLLKRAAWIWWKLAWREHEVTWQRDEALSSLSSSIFTERNILRNLFIVQKNIKGGNASNCTIILLFSDTISRRNNRQLLSPNMTLVLSSFGGLVALSDTYLHE